jgi:hypothetical protein
MIAIDDLTETTLATASVYLAIRLPDGAAGRLAEIQDSLIEATLYTTVTGRQVRYLHGMYIPARNCLLCAFVAESEDAVHAAARRAGLPFVQIDNRPDPGPYAA